MRLLLAVLVLLGASSPVSAQAREPALTDLVLAGGLDTLGAEAAFEDIGHDLGPRVEVTGPTLILIHRGRGALGERVIHAVLGRNRARFRYCFERAVARRPGLAGRVGVRFEIDPKGRVETSVVSSTSLDDARAELCLSAQVAGLTFSPSPQGGSVRVHTFFVLFPPP